MTDWTGGPYPEHNSELTDRPVESPAEFDNWAQDEAAADLEKLEPPPPGSEPA